MGAELAVLTQIKSTTNYLPRQIKNKNPSNVNHYLSVASVNTSDGGIITIADANLAKYNSLGVLVWSKVPSDVSALQDLFSHAYLHTDGYIYCVTLDLASPYTIIVIKVNESTGVITQLGSSFTTTSTDTAGIMSDFIPYIKDGLYYFKTSTATNTGKIRAMDILTGTLTSYVNTFYASGSYMMIHLNTRGLVVQLANNVFSIAPDNITGTLIKGGNTNQVITASNIATISSATQYGYSAGVTYSMVDLYRYAEEIYKFSLGDF